MFSSAGMVGLLDAPLVLDKGASGSALRHESMAADKEWAGVVVRVALASSEFGSLDSMPMLSGGEPVSRHKSPFRSRIILRRGHSISAQDQPSPKLGFGGLMNGSSQREWQGRSSCFKERVYAKGRDRSEWALMSSGRMRESWCKLVSFVAGARGGTLFLSSTVCMC